MQCAPSISVLIIRSSNCPETLPFINLSFFDGWSHLGASKAFNIHFIICVYQDYQSSWIRSTTPSSKPSPGPGRSKAVPMLYYPDKALTIFGMNMPTLSWYLVYSGYFFTDKSSVSQVDPWNKARIEIAPTAVQLQTVSVTKQGQRYSTTQIACSAAKLGWRHQDQRPSTRNPLSRSSCLYWYSTLEVSW